MTQVIDFIGGEYRNRTGVHGFAIRCVTTPPTRRRCGMAGNKRSQIRLQAGTVAFDTSRRCPVLFYVARGD